MHSLNAPCPYIKYWPEYGSLEPKHVANYVLMSIYVLCLTEYITLSYCITKLDSSYKKEYIKNKKIKINIHWDILKTLYNT